MSHVVAVAFRLKPGTAGDFLPHMRAQARNSLDREPGCLQFDVCLDPGDDEGDVDIANAVAPFKGWVVPHGDLSAFDGLDPNGTWTLTIQDFGGATFVIFGSSPEMSINQRTRSSGLTSLDSAWAREPASIVPSGLNVTSLTY